MIFVRKRAVTTAVALFVLATTPTGVFAFSSSLGPRRQCDDCRTINLQHHQHYHDEDNNADADDNQATKATSSQPEVMATTRRSFFATSSKQFLVATSSSSASALLLLSTSSPSVATGIPTTTTAAAPPPPLLQGRGGVTTRIEEIGGGFDVRDIPSRMYTTPDVAYPPSILGIWDTQRVVTSVEGDTEQAKIAWAALAGKDPSAFFATTTQMVTENYQSKYILATSAAKNDENVDKDTMVVLDRGWELASRSAATTTSTTPAEILDWDSVALTYSTTNNKGTKKTELAIVDRQVEPVSDEGFGFNELVRITTTGIMMSLPRVVRVKRRYRRAFDPSSGERIIEGIELVKTYRVLDGVAGIEMPTSTTKSQIRMRRPSRNAE